MESHKIPWFQTTNQLTFDPPKWLHPVSICIHLYPPVSSDQS